jgi:hypothetical protein
MKGYLKVVQTAGMKGHKLVLRKAGTMAEMTGPMMVDQKAVMMVPPLVALSVDVMVDQKAVMMVHLLVVSMVELKVGLWAELMVVPMV